MRSQLLRLVHPTELPPASRQATVELRLECTKSHLIAQFSVRGQTVRVNPYLPHHGSQWGLWEFDVVELFVQGNQDSPTYYEFQVSPLGQYFELEVLEPRKRVNKEYVSGFRHHGKILSETEWNAELVIPLRAIGWNGNPHDLRGNAFAILSKTYWSLSLPQQLQPDFHLPQHFNTLLP